jgi:hypothetical protein
LIRILIVLILIQVPVAILQRLAIIPGAAALGSATADAIGGTLGANGSGILSIVCGMAVAVLLNLFVFDRISLLYLAGAGFLMVPPIIAEGKVALFLPLLAVITILGLQLYIRKNGRWLPVLAAIFLGGALAYAVVFLLPLLSPTASQANFGTLTSLDTLLQYLTRVGGDPRLAVYGRLTDFRITMDVLRVHLTPFLFGFGPGLLTKTGQALNALSQLHPDLNRGLGGTSLTNGLLEIGFVGIGAFWLPLIIVCAKALGVARLKMASPYAFLFSTSYIVALAIYLLSFFYTFPFLSPALSVTFWIFVGLTWSNAVHEPRQAKA